MSNSRSPRAGRERAVQRPDAALEELPRDSRGSAARDRGRRSGWPRVGGRNPFLAVTAPGRIPGAGRLPGGAGPDPGADSHNLARVRDLAQAGGDRAGVVLLDRGDHARRAPRRWRRPDQAHSHLRRLPPADLPARRAAGRPPRCVHRDEDRGGGLGDRCRVRRVHRLELGPRVCDPGFAPAAAHGPRVGGGRNSVPIRGRAVRIAHPGRAAGAAVGLRTPRRTLTVKRLTALLALLCLPLAACGEKAETITPSARSAQSLTLMLDWFPNADHVGIYQALAEGDFAKAGLDVHVQVPSNPASPLQLLAAGKIDAAISYEPELLLARNRNLPLVSVAAIVQQPLTSIVSLDSKHIKTAAQLRGKRVGDAGIPYQHAYLQTILAHAGVPAASVKEINVGSNLLPAMLSGRCDG